MPFTILMVDDEPSIPKLVGIYLENLIDDYELVSAENGTEAIAKAERLISEGKMPDIAVLDLRMPDMSGIECMERLQNLGIENIYILTAYARSDMVPEVEKSGAKGVLKKSKGFKAIAEFLAERSR